MKRIFFAAICLILAGLQLTAQTRTYKFNSNFSERCGLAQPLITACSDSFYTDILPDLGNISRSVHHFGQNCGVLFDNGANGHFLGETYSLELYFKFDNSTGFSRILDFKNRNSDYGLYCTESQLQFYNASNVATTAFTSGQYVYLVVTRDSAIREVRQFVNGQQIDVFTDVNDIAVTDTSEKIWFFQDDLLFGGEASAGSVALIRLYNNTLDSSQVADAFSRLAGELTPNGFTVNDLVQCINGNDYIFTNISPDSLTSIFDWNFDDGNSSQNLHAQHSYVSPGKYDVRLLVTDTLGCVDTVLQTVSVYAQPVVSLGPDPALCNSTPQLLDAGSFTDYLWNDGSTLQTLSVSAPGSYAVTVTDANGCTGSDSVDVTITPLVSLGSDTFFCGSVSLLLDAGSGLASYSWSDGSSLQTLAASDSGTYMVTVADGNGCLNTDTIYLGITETPELFLGNDTALCPGTTLSLDAGPFFTYLWQDSSAGQFYTVGSAGTYAVRITSFSGCSNTDTITVSVLANPVVNLGGDSLFCGAVAISLDAGNGQAAYLWNDGSTSQSLAVNDSGSYSVEVTDANGCKARDTIQLGILQLPSVELGNDTSLCQGSSLILDAGPLYTYAWQDGSTNQTFTVNVDGTYSVQITDLAGCANKDSVTVSFLSLPAISLGSDTGYCDSLSLTLQAGTGFAVYLWDNGSTNSTLDITTGGVFSVLVTDNNGCQSSDTITIGLGITPVFSLMADTAVCDGIPVLLDAGAGYPSYLWSTGETVSSIQVSDSGAYMVTVSDSLGCQSSDQFNLTLLPVPVVVLGPDTAFCFGGSVLLDAGSGFTSYLWSDSSITQTILVTQNGTYLVIVTNSSGCSGTDSVKVTVHPGPMNPNIFVSGGTTLVSNQPAGNQWYNASGPIPGATDPFYIPTQAGSYYVIVTDSNGCQSSPSNTIVWGAGIFSPDIQVLQSYPNPAGDQLHLLTGKIRDERAVIEITDLQGRVVWYQVSGLSQDQDELRLDVSRLQPGAYLIRMMAGERIWISRMLKQ